MKRFLAFMMSLVLCFVCLGTYGFESDHDHSGHMLHAADAEAYVYIEVYSAIYNAAAETMTVTLNIGCDSTSKIRAASIKITTPRKPLGQPTVKDGFIFGQNAIFNTEVKSDSEASVVTISLQDSSANSTAPTGYLVLEYPVNSQYLDFSFYRSVEMKFSGQVKTITGQIIEMDPLFNSKLIYICEHNNIQEVVTKQPTCKEGGEKSVVCKSCNYVIETEELAKTMHDYDYSNPISPAIFDYKAATCTTVGYGCFKCKICGENAETFIPATGHTLGARYLDGIFYKQTCSVCGVTVIAENQCAHDTDKYVIKTIEKASTCTTKGSAVYQCPTCFETETRELPLSDHNVTKWTTAYEATCTDSGLKTGICTVCSKTVTEVIPTTGHAYGDWVVGSAATCTAGGYDKRTCENCGKTETRATEAGGHVYGNWVIVKEATCTDTGLKKRVCANCAAESTELIATTSHTYGAWSVAKASTCTEKGVETRSCLECSQTQTRDIAIDANAHKYGEWNVVEEKSCITSGVKEHTCEYCGVKERAVDECEGHLFGAATVDGKTSTKVCSICGYKEVTKTVKNGVEKTLSGVGGSLTVTGGSASGDIAFEISAMAADDLAYYKQYYSTIETAYTYKVLVGDREGTITSDMSLTINLGGAFEDYDCKIYVLNPSDRGLYPVSEFERKGTNVTISGEDLTGMEAIFVEKGEESKPNYIVPIVITVVTLAVAGAAIAFFVVKGKNKETF